MGAHGIDRHDVGGTGGVDIDSAAERAPEIAVRDEPGKRPISGEYAGGAMRMTRHRDDRIAKRIARLGARAPVERLQSLAHGERQVTTQLPGWVESRKVGGAEAALRHEGSRERVAEGERQERARGRHQAKRIGFGAGADIEDHVGLRRQRRLRVADDGDDRGLEGA